MKELGGAQKWEDVGVHQSCDNVLSKSWWGRWQRNKGRVSPTQPELQHITAEEQNQHVLFIFCLKPRLIVFYLSLPIYSFYGSIFFLRSTFSFLLSVSTQVFISHFFTLWRLQMMLFTHPEEGWMWLEWGLTCDSLLVMLMELWGALGTTRQNHEAKQQLKPLLSSFQQSKSNFVLSWLSLVKIPIRNI